MTNVSCEKIKIPLILIQINFFEGYKRHFTIIVNNILSLLLQGNHFPL